MFDIYQWNDEIPLFFSYQMENSILEMVSVALFVPNIIGYIRAVTGILSFYFVDSNPTSKLIIWIDL